MAKKLDDESHDFKSEIPSSKHETNLKSEISDSAHVERPRGADAPRAPAAVKASESVSG
jgi:hypothetical protein